jgi:hypothetical protein
VDLDLTERADVELNRLLTKCHDPRDGEALLEPTYAESVRAYNARCGEERRLERLHYHEGQVRRLSNTLGALVAYHEREAEKYRNGHHEEGAA